MPAAESGSLQRKSTAELLQPVLRWKKQNDILKKLWIKRRLLTEPKRFGWIWNGVLKISREISIVWINVEPKPPNWKTNL
jgi:hypothetical protein